MKSILFVRDGVSSGQLDEVLLREVQALVDACSDLGADEGSKGCRSEGNDVVVTGVIR